MKKSIIANTKRELPKFHTLEDINEHFVPNEVYINWEYMFCLAFVLTMLLLQKNQQV